jgi:anti-anti-sigma factor
VTLTETSVEWEVTVSKAVEGSTGSTDRYTVSVQPFPGNRMVIRVSGDVDGDASAEMRRHLTEQLSASSEVLVVDLCEVTGIDADGVEALIATAAVAGESDIGFCLVVRDRGAVRGALGAAEATELFEVFPSVSEALSATD